jgi:hypothetical protein
MRLMSNEITKKMTMGEKSKPPIEGRKARTGASAGSVTRVTKRANGAAGELADSGKNENKIRVMSASS